MANLDLIYIYLIRHGEAGKSWTEDPDPGLSDIGENQAKETAKWLLGELTNDSYQVWSSPLLRAQQTAEAFQQDYIINPGFAEIPSPPTIPIAKRGEWLREIFMQKIADLDPTLLQWRANMINELKQINQTTLIFSHFMVVNALTGWITGQERLVHFKPDYCSITKIAKKGAQFEIIQLGNEMDTLVR